MSLDYDLTQVNRDAWPDGGLPLFDFCMMMLVCGVGQLKTDADMERLKNRAMIIDSFKNFGWYHPNKEEGQQDMIDLIPLMKGIRTNVSNYSRKEFFDRLKSMGVKEL